MRSRRSQFALFGVSLLLAVLTGSVSAPAAPFTSTVTVPIAGMVTAGQSENVTLSGSVQILSTVAVDQLLGNPPRERLSIKLVNVSGVGLSTGTTYVAKGEQSLLRVLVLSDLIEITFPFFPNTPSGASSARSALASITLKFDLLTGALTGATARFSSPNFGG